MINIGKYIEMAINWLTENFAGLFDVINHIVGGFIDGFQGILMWVPFYLMIAGIAALAWWKAGKGTAVLTLLGLLLIWGMGFWVQTMQTVALVLSSTIIALLLGVPLGIWTGRNDKAAKVIRPVLDLMQTMPAFVYLIPAVLFFGLGRKLDYSAEPVRREYEPARRTEMPAERPARRRFAKYGNGV